MDTRKIRDLRQRDWDGISSAKLEALKKASPSEYGGQLIGIEVEAENFHGVASNTELDYIWKRETDGSLRNNGIEFISRPIKVEHARYAVELLMKSQLEPLDFSLRTSVHVHMDVRDNTYEQLLNLIYLYIVFEDSLFRYAGDFRKKSIFCVPIKETMWLLSSRMVHVPDIIMEGNVWMKYTAMNLLPVSRQGTVEFRHLQGSGEVKYISTWIELLARMKKYADTHTYEELSERIFSLVTTSEYFQLGMEVFGDLVGHIFTGGKVPVRELDSSVKFLKANLCASKYSELPLDLNTCFMLTPTKSASLESKSIFAPNYLAQTVNEQAFGIAFAQQVGTGLTPVGGGTMTGVFADSIVVDEWYNFPVEGT